MSHPFAFPHTTPMPTLPLARSRVLLAAAVVAMLAAIPIGLLVRQLPLPRIGSISLLVALLVLCVVATAVVVLAPLARRFGKVHWAVLAVALLGGWMLGGAWTFKPAPDQELLFRGTVAYPDGTRRNEAPGTMVDWGKQVRGFGLHSPAPGVSTPHGVVFELTDAPAVLDLLLAKPAGALYQNGRPTASDGISVKLTVRGKDGQAQEDSFDVSQKDFLRRKWVKHRVRAEGGIASIAVDVGTGPAGSTPHFDSTMVGLEHVRPFPDWLAMAKRLLFAWSFAGLAIWALLWIPVRASTASPARARAPVSRHVAAMAAAGLVVALVSWSALHSNFIYFWDYRNYWGKTEELYELAKIGDWRTFWNAIVAQYAANYSLIPAVPPALAGLLAGYPTRVTYTLLLTLLYAVPAYLLVCYFGQRLAGGGGTIPGSSWLIAFLCVFFGLPQMLNHVLYLMPDIGGIVVWAGAFLSADRALKALVDSDPLAPDAGKARTDLVRNSLGLGLCLTLMFLFRRWYVFASVGVAVAVALIAAFELWRRRGVRRELASRIAAAAMLVAFAALPVVSGVAFEWSRDLASHDYAALYAGYNNTAWTDFVLFLDVVGVVALAVCVGGILIALRARTDMRLWVLLTVSVLVAWALFFKVQSPGRHNYYLLMPLLGAGLFVSATSLMRRFGRGAGVALLVVLLFGNVGAPRIADASPWVRLLYPSYADWLPKQQPHANGYREAARFLSAPENKDRKLCVIASSGSINQSIFAELWQLEPSFDKHASQQRVVHLSQVDTMDGPPGPNLRECGIALVGVPFLYHRTPKEQYTVQIVQQDLISGQGIGAAYQRAGAPIDMGDGIQLVPFRQARPVSADEYQDLVRRFLKAKGPGYVNPAPGTLSSAP